MSLSNKIVEHDGIVEEVLNKIIKVRILQESACASCHAKQACLASDTSEKIIDVYSLPNSKAKVGDSVVIQGQQSLGLKASLLAYIIPFALVVLTLVITFSISNNEIISGISSLLILVPYFLVIKYISPRLEKTFIFTQKQIIE